MKYKVSNEFFPFSLFTLLISEKFLKMAVLHMKTPKYIFNNNELEMSSHETKGTDHKDGACG